MTPDWVKPLALQEIARTVECFCDGIVAVYRARDTDIQWAWCCIEEAERLTTLQTFEWAIAQQNPFDIGEVIAETIAETRRQLANTQTEGYTDEFGRVHR